eukprot:5019086-Amphidinium_carterae.3
MMTEDQVPRSRLFGAFCTRGRGITQSTTQYPHIVKACLDVAATRKHAYPFASMQLTTHTYLPCHQDRNNYEFSRIIGLGEYSGGRLWCESPIGSHPPPITHHAWQKQLRGDYFDVNHRWHCFDDHHLQDLDELGFPMSDVVANTVTPEVYPDKVPDDGTPEVPVDTPPALGPELKLNSDVWFQGERDLPEPYQQAMHDFTSSAHLEGVCVSVSSGEKTPFTPEELAELKEHIREGHLTKSHLCRACVLGSGPVDEVPPYSSP